MTEVWIYLDESGTPDFDLGAASSPYFAVGGAVFRSSQARVLEQFVMARSARRELANGFHAYDDSPKTKTLLFDVMRNSEAEFAFTFMAKANAYPYVQTRPKIWLYQYALYLHLKASIPSHSRAGDTVHVVAAHISMGAKQAAVEQAIAGVCRQLSSDRTVIPHIWKSPTSAGLQMADYALWAVQRSVVHGKPCHHYELVVEPRQTFCHFPWARDVRGLLRATRPTSGD